MIVTKSVRTANDYVEPLVLTETMAYVRNNVKVIDEPGTEDAPGFKGFEYDEIEYTKDEFIAVQAKQTNELNAAVDDILIMLPELVGGTL